MTGCCGCLCRPVWTFVDICRCYLVDPQEMFMTGCCGCLLDAQLDNVGPCLEQMSSNLSSVHQDYQPVVNSDDDITFPDAALPGGAALHHVVQDEMKAVIFTEGVS